MEKWSGENGVISILDSMHAFSQVAVHDLLEDDRPVGQTQGALYIGRCNAHAHAATRVVRKWTGTSALS